MSKGKAEGYVLVKAVREKCCPGVTQFPGEVDSVLLGFPIKSLSPNKILQEKNSLFLPNLTGN